MLFGAVFSVASVYLCVDFSNESHKRVHYIRAVRTNFERFRDENN